MKPQFFKKILYILLIIGSLVLINKSTHAQDVTVTVKALQNLVNTPLDSILVMNETNNSVLKLGNLPQNQTEYMVNLNQAKVIQATTGIEDFSMSKLINIRGIISGFELTTDFENPQQLSVDVYSMEGKWVLGKKLSCNQGISTFPIYLAAKGMYLVKTTTQNQVQSFKVYLESLGAIAATEKAEPVKKSAKVLKGTNDNFSYTTGDRVQLVVKKGTLKSQTWYGRPINGNIILVALPKSTTVFDMKQTISGGAQTFTISFSGLAFYSGCFYASSFYPPGKIADYFGFQYMRDNDPDESGHNTDFLTKAAYHMMNLLNSQQMQILIDLAQVQEKQFNDYALGRLVLIKAFHRYLDNSIPVGTTMMNLDSVKKVSRNLYLIDGDISYNRAIKFAEIIKSLTETQRDTLYKLSAQGMQMWVMPSKPTVSIPKGLNTWVMSNASELFSWFLRGVEAGIYFCPERQGTYFGGFYMKDAPAVGTPGYAIDPQATAQKGSYMLSNILSTSQASEIKGIYTANKSSLDSIVFIRTKIANELRNVLSNKTINKDSIMAWSAKYGEYDGVYNYNMVEKFVKVGRQLTADQKSQLITLRDLANYPCKAGRVFIYSEETDEPVIPSTDFLFK